MANINVKCPHCDATLSVAADLPGKLVNCPLCNKHFNVPMDIIRQTQVTDQPGAAIPNQPQQPDQFKAQMPPANNMQPGFNGNQQFVPPANNMPGANGYPANFIPQNMVKTYLVESILVTLLCCMPLGVVAIVFAAQASSLLSIQQYQLALKSAETAKKWMIASLICGIVVSIIYVGLSILAQVAQK
jgi:hypothetical protein